MRMNIISALVFTATFLTATSVAQAQGDAARGEKKFEECASCHSVERGSNGVGPNLAGLFERKAGALDDYRYSPALKRSGITWTPQALDAYVADPQKAIPQNRMPYAGMPEARDRADLIAYMKEAFK